MPSKPKPQIIYVDAGANVASKIVHGSDAVIWVPVSDGLTITITFPKDHSPFRFYQLHAGPGECTGGLVTGPISHYPYHLTVATFDAVKGQVTAEADPEIIVDPGSNTPPGGRNGGGKAVKKQGGGARKSGGAKKGGKKKAAKRR